MKKRIRNKEDALIEKFQKEIFLRRKGISKLWKIPNHPIKRLIRRLKLHGFRSKCIYNVYSFEQIILILKDKKDYECCMYFIGEKHFNYLFEWTKRNFEGEIIQKAFKNMIEICDDESL